MRPAAGAGRGRVLILSASMGAGHDGAARELGRRLDRRGYDTHHADFLECFPFRLGRFMRWVYGMQLARAPWAYEATFRVWYVTPLLCRALAFVLSVLTGRRVRRLLDPSDVAIVSTYPLNSVVLGRGRRRGWVRPPVVTFVTDFGVHPLWVHPDVDLTLCVHDVSARVVQAATARPVVTTGPMVAPAYRSGPRDKAAARRALGLPAAGRIALVVAGSWGVGDLESTFDALLDHDGWTPVVVCGNNADIRERLSRRGTGIVLGWTDRMPELMCAADVLVQNAGGLSCMEAFAVGLPVVTFHPIPGHGRQNAADMEAAGVAATVADPAQLGEVLDAVSGERGRVLAANGRSLFRDDPAAVVDRLAAATAPAGAVPRVGHRAPHGTAPRPRPRHRSRHRTPARRRLVAGTLGLAGLYGGFNLVADAAAAHGVDAARAEKGQNDVYLAVRLGPTALAAPGLPGILAADHVTAVVDGRTTAADPAAVRALARGGVDVATSGWAREPGYHIEAPTDGLARATRAIRLATGLNCREFAPASAVSGVDLASAMLHHVRIVRGSTVALQAAAGHLEAHHIYILRADRADGVTIERSLTELVLAAAHQGLEVAPLSDLR